MTQREEQLFSFLNTSRAEIELLLDYAHDILMERGRGAAPTYTERDVIALADLLFRMCYNVPSYPLDACDPWPLKVPA